MDRNILIVLLIILGIISLILIQQVIGMLIDHHCYQLTPNEFYQSTICERYWNYGNMDKNSR